MRRRPLLIALALLIVAFLVAIVVGLVPVLAGRAGHPHLPAECALVFGTGLHDGQPGPAMRRRVGNAAELWRKGQVQRLVMSGGRRQPDEPSQAQVMRDLAVTLGVPATAVALEQASRNTLENLALSQPLLRGCRGVVGVSEPYHLARIELLAARDGRGQLATVPADPPNGPMAVVVTVREALGWLWYRVGVDTWL